MIDRATETFDRLTARQSLHTDHPRPVPPPKSAYKLEEFYITIDSRDRDRTMWPTANQFQVRVQPEDSYKGALLSRSYKNVKLLEVISVSFPNTNNVLDQMYLYLTFPELDGVFDASNAAGTKAMAKLVPTSLIGSYVHVRFAADERYPKKRFYGKGARIDRLTPEFRTVDGELFNFGADTAPPSACNPRVQTSITLRVVVQTPLAM